MQFRRVYILLPLDGMLYKYLMCHLRPVFPYGFSVWMMYPSMKVGYLCVTVDFSFYIIFLCWVHIYLSSFIDPLIIMYFPSLSLITVFILKSISSGMSIAMPAFLSLHLHGIPFSIPHI